MSLNNRQIRNSIRHSLLFIALAGLAACYPQQQAVAPSPTAMPQHTCGDFITASPEFICIELTDQGHLIQTSQSQIILSDGSVTVTLAGSMIAARTEDALLLAIADGTAAVSIIGQTRTLTAGMIVSITPDQDELHLTVGTIDLAVIGELTRADLPLWLEQATSPERDRFIARLSSTAITCQPDRWQAEYAVQRGDTLSSIAAAYNLPLADLQSANCITHPQGLQVGQTLFIPYPQ